VLKAVNRIAAKARRQGSKLFGQIILAAADVDADVFRALSTAFTEVASRTTLYVSNRDWSLQVAQRLTSFPRVGPAPPTMVLPGIDTINVANPDVTILDHGYFANARDVLTDMHVLITSGLPPDRRFGLRGAKNEQGERYWILGH
jgi:esterase/lipase superfamily enzyme